MKLDTEAGPCASFVCRRNKKRRVSEEISARYLTAFDVPYKMVDTNYSGTKS